MATYTKLTLSGSVNGKQILVSSGSSAASEIHTAVAGTSALDEIYIYAYNNATSSVVANILWGGTTEPNDLVKWVIPPQNGRYLIVDGKLLQNSLIVKAYADQTNSLLVDGFVNRIS